MICLHCGHCCKNYCVVIISDPNKNYIENNLEYHEGNNVSCKHLLGDKIGKYNCAIHDHKLYNQTPCYDFTQIEHSNTECRTGRYILNKTNLNEKT